MSDLSARERELLQELRELGTFDAVIAEVERKLWSAFKKGSADDRLAIGHTTDALHAVSVQLKKILNDGKSPQ